jgi:glycosyltransferase involved in cell wall biosynthesis
MSGEERVCRTEHGLCPQVEAKTLARPLRMLFVTPYFPPQTGGVATFVDAIQRLLRERGHEVTVLVPGSSHTLIPMETSGSDGPFELYFRTPWVPESPLRGFGGWCLHALPTLGRIARFIRSRRIQLVILEYPLTWMYYFLALRRLVGVKLIVGVHGDDVLSLPHTSRHEQWLVRRLVRQADWLVGHSRSLLAATERIVGPLREQQSCIPYGIEPERVRRLAQSSGQLPFGLEAPYVLTVAKLYPRKAIEVLLRAISGLGELPGKWRFVIVGDGPEEQHLRELASRLRIADRVVFTGELTLQDTAGLHERCEFFVLPSRSEPFGIALLEAMAFGKAVVATRVGGIPEFVRDGQNGILVEADDSDALGAAMTRLLKDPALRARLGAEGYRTADGPYNYAQIIHEYERCFRRVLGKEGRAAELRTHQ